MDITSQPAGETVEDSIVEQHDIDIYRSKKAIELAKLFFHEKPYATEAEAAAFIDEHFSESSDKANCLAIWKKMRDMEMAVRQIALNDVMERVLPEKS